MVSSEMGPRDGSGGRRRRTSSQVALGRHWPAEAPVRGRWYSAYLIALCALVAVSVAVQLPSLPAVLPTASVALWLLVGLAVTLAVAVDAPLLRIRGWGGSWVMASMTPCYAITYSFGHGTGRSAQVLAIVAASTLGRQGVSRTAFDIGRYGVALAVSSSVAGLLGRVPVTQSDPAGLLDAFLAALAWYAAFRLATATGTWLVEGGRWAQALRRDLPIEAVSAAALLCLAVLLLGFTYGNVWLIPVVLVPLLAVTLMSYVSWQRSMRDPMTGLPNRVALERSVREPIRRFGARPPGAELVALLALDILQLGRVNDALGHRVGDQVLVAVGHRLASLAGPDTFVARLQSDKFAILLWPVPSTEEVVARAAAVRSIFDEPLSVSGFPLLTSVSIGVSLCPAHATDFDALLRYADAALARAKGLPTRVAIFQPSQEVATADQLTLVHDLARTVEEPGNTEIVPFYQPQVELSSGRVIGAEALLRWRHPTRGLVSPEQVVRAAEHTPVMEKITRVMIERVIAQLANWQSEGMALTVSVNVSVRDLYSSEFVDWLGGRLRHFEVDPSRLQVELTETALMNQAAAVLTVVNALSRLGVGASLDDFGTGFSSLQHLRQLPLAEIKIDKSFVQSMAGHREEASIVGAVIDMGRRLGLRVVAEGVEDDRTRARLLEAGCPVAQGWYFAGPMPADEFAEWCRRPAVHLTEVPERHPDAARAKE